MWHSACVSAPSGVVTFLFTDIEGSTRRWETDADAMRSALAAHDKVLRSAIEAHDGFLFSHTGDGVVCGVRLAEVCCRAAVARNARCSCRCEWGSRPVRPTLQDGDYFGAVLNRAARVMAAGHGGQVLVADSTAASGQWSRPARPGAAAASGCAERRSGCFRCGRRVCGPTFRHCGRSIRVRGICGPRSTSFIGRDVEVAEIKEALRSHRLVTLTGVGGVGKTRLAMEVAAQLGDEFPDGVWLFELAAVDRSSGGA